MSIVRKTLVSIVAAAAALPSPLLACATCHGRSDSPLAFGMNWGIFTLMGIIGAVLVSIAGFFAYILHREAAVNRAAGQQQVPAHAPV
ncbi:MAG: hypothetical protein KGJ88_10195 [Verrucomicrobiota bacterium]|nr:hypothetical protein [Verrucomicrobiota bacterium]